MPDAAHRIGRISLRLRADDRATLDPVVRDIRARFDAIVLGALQAAFDGLDSGSNVIRIDRLTLDLGTLTPADPDLATALQGALAHALADAAPGQRAGTDGAGMPDMTAELIAFLRQGRLPWPEPGRAMADIVLSLQRLDDGEMAALAQQLLPELSVAAVAQRFLAQMPAWLIRRFVVALADRPDDGIAMPLGEYPTRPDAARLEPMLLVVARSGGAAAAAAALASALSASASPATDPSSGQEAVVPPADARPTPAAESTPNEATYPVSAAGAVLLYPYLSRFFAALDLLRGTDFRDHFARRRAVLLGQFLATGDEDPDEVDCLLMKLLCGLPLQAPLPRLQDIGGVERGEAMALLRAVIGHWGRLGATSPEGLREGFLCRPGLLRLGPDAPVLQVERRSIDILLDRLPWTISHVTTPFMDRVLTVEWV